MPVHDGAGLDTLNSISTPPEGGRCKKGAGDFKDMMRDSIDLPLLASSHKEAKSTLVLRNDAFICGYTQVLFVHGTASSSVIRDHLDFEKLRLATSIGAEPIKWTEFALPLSQMRITQS
jgi:hypothetical protein